MLLRSRLEIRSGMPAVAEFFVPELMMLGLGDQRQRRRQDAGISRPGDFHEAAGKPGQLPFREFLAGRRFLDPSGVDPAESGLPGKDIGRETRSDSGRNGESNGGKGLLHHGFLSADIGSAGLTRQIS